MSDRRIKDMPDIGTGYGNFSDNMGTVVDSDQLSDARYLKFKDFVKTTPITITDNNGQAVSPKSLLSSIATTTDRGVTKFATSDEVNGLADNVILQPSDIEALNKTYRSTVVAHGWNQVTGVGPINLIREYTDDISVYNSYSSKEQSLYVTLTKFNGHVSGTIPFNIRYNVDHIYNIYFVFNLLTPPNDWYNCNAIIQRSSSINFTGQVDSRVIMGRIYNDNGYFAMTFNDFIIGNNILFTSDDTHKYYRIMLGGNYIVY